MVLGWLASAASQVTRPVWDAVQAVGSLPAGRRACGNENRTHFEVRGIHRLENAEAARALKQRLTTTEGVHSCEVNAVLGRVIVEHDSGVTTSSSLAAVLSDAEREHGLDRFEAAPAGIDHPGDAAPLLREVGGFAASVAGLGYVAATSLLPIRTLPPLLPTAISLAESVPWMRHTLQAGLGRPATETVFTIGSTLSQGLARNPMGLTTGACLRWCTAREAIARRQAWQRWESALASRSGAHSAEALEAVSRPHSLPQGPVEQVANVSGAVAVAGYGTILALAASPQRALAALTAGVPRASKAGRESFAAHLAGTVSTRGGLVFDPDALRRLDRVNTVVLDADVLLTGRHVVDTVTALDTDFEEADLFERAHELVDPRRPTDANRRGEWSCSPIEPARLDELGSQTPRQHAEHGATIVLLSHRSRPVALVSVVTELDPLAEDLAATAGAAGDLVLAGTGCCLEHRLPFEHVVPGGDRIADSVRELQTRGGVVALVSARNRPGLAAADVGIGVATDSDTPPWGAHLVCPGPAGAHTLLAATEQARAASRHGAVLAVAGSGLGAVFATLGPALGASTRASLPVNAAALCAIGLGTWAGIQAADRPPPPGRQRVPWHAIPGGSVLTLLDSSPEGLDDAEAGNRSSSAREPDARQGVARATLEGLINPMTPLLGAGAVVSAGLGSVVDAVMITSVLGTSALIDAVQTVSTNRELSRLLDVSRLPARLRRCGVVRSESADSLVVGDVIELHAGDGVPADCRLLETEGLELDEAGLTGESQLVAKTPQSTTATAVADRTCIVYQGTVVAAGWASAVVVATGACTEVGRTARENGSEQRAASGVADRLGELTKQTLPLSAGAGAALMLVDLLRASPPGQAISRAVGLAVAAVPEGLPFVATVAELAAARRLSAQGMLVRSPTTIEALGRVDALCFDKTGTLTQGRISLRHVSDGTTIRSVDDLTDELREVLSAGVRASPRQDNKQPLAHPTDRAVLSGAERAGVTDGYALHPELLAELPFEPSRGFHAVCTDGPRGTRLSVKGAPEGVFDRCSRRSCPDGYHPFDGATRAALEDEMERLALSGFRVLAVAERDGVDRVRVESRGLEDSDVDGMDFVGLLVLADPVQPTASESVAELRRGGVDVIMITGDHPSTAEAVAAELDMLAGRRVMQGAELDAIEDDQLVAELPKIAVFARVSPSQKARIVRQLRRTDRVVAMTGDGANDVPAIRLADVGIAVGTHATPAARESADLVIADERIETIGRAIIEGRGMWASVHDALSILLGGNIGEIAYGLGAGLFGQAALNARQLLVVNLLTDVLPALAIAVRPPPGATPERLLAEGPEASLGSALNRDVYSRAVATAGAAGAAWLLTRPVATSGQARTAGLVALVSAQLAQTLAVRGRTPLVLAATAASMIVLALVVQWPGVSQLFGSQPLLPHQWATALAAATAAAVAVTVWQARARGAKHTGSAT